MTGQRAPRGFTFDPCPGCGASDDTQARPKEGVCASCRLILNQHAKLAAEAQERGFVSVGVPAASHWLPYIGDKHQLQKRFHELALAVSVPSSGGVDFLDESRRLVLLPKINHGSDWSPWEPKDFRTMPAPVALALRNLYEGMLEAVPAAREEGKTDGRNLLAMLCAGELTNAEFERRAGIIPER